MNNPNANTMIVYLIDSLTKSNTNRMKKKNSYQRDKDNN